MDTDAKKSDLAPPHSHLRQPKSILERLIDSFLQESSIQWMLVIGAAIISASSLMLVTRQWTSLPVTLKFLTILGYTMATYGAAEYCGRRLRLNATSQVLRCLTLILIPIGFLSLAWLSGTNISLSNSAMTLVLLVPATGFMVFAADRIFSHWLHGRQHAFVAAYMLLSLAGAMPVINATWLAVLCSTGFWLVMTMGVIQVNRHLFWLVEEHRSPRVFGFFPIAILATQCIVLIVTKTIEVLPFQWLGLGFVMLAGTILMTTKTIADVFRQRTGNLVHPLPWSIMAPLIVGLMLTAAGVLCSFHGFSFSGAATRAVVPTAVIAAGLMFTIGRDTRNRGFVWLGLILITIGYQSCPTLLGEFVQTLKSGAASAVREDRLPFAFYGLTYLPLLAGFSLASRSLGRRDRNEFQIPLKQFVSVASVFLALLSLTHWKAAFIVSTISVLAFVFHSIVLRDRRFVLAAIGCVTLSAATAIPFADSMGPFHGDSRWTFVAVSLLGFTLSNLPVLDRLLCSSLFEHREPVKWFRIAGQFVTVASSVIWAGVILVPASNATLPAFDELDWIVVCVITSTLLLLTTSLQNYLSGMWMWLIALASVGLYTSKMVASDAALLTLFAVGTGSATLATYLVLRASEIDASPRRFLTYHLPTHQFRCPSAVASVLLPLADLTLVIFTLIVGVYFLPTLLWATITLDVSILPIGWVLVGAIIVIGVILFRGALATATALFLAPVMAGVSVGMLAPEWFSYPTLPLVYALTSAIVLTMAGRNGRTQHKWTIGISLVWLAFIAPLGMLYLSPLVLAGSAVSILAMLLIQRRSAGDRSNFRTGLVILASLQWILSAAMFAGFRGFLYELPTSPLIVPACVWMLAAAVIALVPFEHCRTGMDTAASRTWSLAVRAFAVLFFVVCLASSGFAGYERAVIVISLVVAACVECHVAMRRQMEEHVWGLCAVIGLMVAWFHLHPQILVSHMLLRLMCVSTAAGFLIFAQRYTNHVRLHIFVRTATVVGIVLPVFVTLWSSFASAHGAAELLIIFAAAATWFVYGRTNSLRAYVIGAAAMLNIGLLTLFAAWSLSDPQMYLIPIGLTVIGLVELLRADIPTSAHDPLRYVGGLAILVSPCFEILGGSWLHIVSLMILSVLVILLAIGVRLRALIHLGTAFLCVDLVAMVIRSSIDHPGMLWVTGLVIGASVIAIAATCEHYRESLLSRIRILSAELSTWQ